MVVMVLDHARHAFTLFGNPDDVATASPALFLTRWVTHFCAPVFVFLAGTSAWLYGSRGRSQKEVAWFLASRGLWLIVLEVTVVTFGWVHSLDMMFWQVIAAIGLSMMVLSLVMWWPRIQMLIVGGFLVAGQDAYNLLGEYFTGRTVDVWRVLQGGMFRPYFGLINTPIADVIVIYPVLPWIGVMILGYLAGGLLTGEASQRRVRFLITGVVLITAFVVVRVLDGFGNVASFRGQAETGPGWMAFLRCEKYPPSLAYLLMTLGPAFLALACFERVPGAVTRFLQVFGRVPMFFYILHIYVLHCGSRLLFWITEGEPVLLLRAEMSGLTQAGLTDAPFEPLPDGFVGFDLLMAYVITALTVAMLYPLCRWYGGVKQRSKSVLLSYL